MDEGKRAECQGQLDLCDTGCLNVSTGTSVSRTVDFGVDSRHLTMVMRLLLASGHTRSHGVTEILREYQQRKQLSPDGKMGNINF